MSWNLSVTVKATDANNQIVIAQQSQRITGWKTISIQKDLDVVSSYSLKDLTSAMSVITQYSAMAGFKGANLSISTATATA
jgi:hypothetical protein